MKEQEHPEQLERIRKYYDTAQKYYERVWYWGGKGLGLHYGLWMPGVRSRILAIVKENEVLADLATVNPSDLILDAGCGVGGSGIWLTEERGAKVVGLNIVKSQLRKGLKLTQSHSVTETLHFTQADYHRLPFPSNTFDVFWALESIEHSDDVHTLIKEAFRTLKPGGKAVIAGTFRGITKPTDRQKEYLQVGFRTAGAFNDFHSANEIQDLMFESGFNNSQNYDVTRFVMPSARQMRDMCRVGLPLAKLGHNPIFGRLRISQIMVDNTAWGIYQEDLFSSGVTAYNIITARKNS